MANPLPLAVPGKNPGEVFIPALGQSFQQIELREDDIHDSILLTGTTITAGYEAILFRDVTNKNEQHTSLLTSRKISAGDEAAVFRIGAHPRGAIGNQIPLFADMKKAVENGTLRVQFNKRQITEGPIIKYQSGYGISGYSAESGATSFTIGVPSAAAAPTLFVPQQLTDTDDISAKFRYPDAQWLSSTILSVAFVYANPVLSQAVVLSCFLHAILKAPLGK